MPSELEPHTGPYPWDEAFAQCEEHSGEEPYFVPDDVRARVWQPEEAA